MDIDIDFPSTVTPSLFFKDAILASRVENGELRKHPAGVYLQTIPKDAISNLSAIPFKEAEELGYFKFDFLHLTLLDVFESKDEIRTLLKMEPEWTLLDEQKNVEKLFQLHNHFDVVQIIKPKSIEDICDCISIIRPGKRHLLKFYRENKEFIRKELYKKPDNPENFYFKRSHGISYSLNIILQLHLIKGEII